MAGKAFFRRPTPTSEAGSIANKINMFERTLWKNDEAMIQELRESQRLMSDRSSSTHSTHSTSHNHIPTGVAVDDEGLIMPKKIHNPCLESRECQDLNRQIRWNAKAGINPLSQKTELQKAMEKRNQHRKELEKMNEVAATKTPFQKMLEERAKRIEDLETGPHGDEDNSGDSGHCSPEPESEFLRVHAQVKRRPCT